MTWIGTVSGRRIDYESPDESQISILDIAEGLSKIPRFAGQSENFYSVAQHCVECSYRSAEPLKALLHDSAEAYMGDAPTPLKDLLGEAWRTIEDRLQAAIYRRFGVDPSKSAELKSVDHRMLFTERRDFQPRHADWGWECEPYPDRLMAWPWATARDRYLLRFGELRGAKAVA